MMIAYSLENVVQMFTDNNSDKIKRFKLFPCRKKMVSQLSNILPLVINCAGLLMASKSRSTMGAT